MHSCNPALAHMLILLMHAQQHTKQEHSKRSILVPRYQNWCFNERRSAWYPHIHKGISARYIAHSIAIIFIVAIRMLCSALFTKEGTAYACQTFVGHLIHCCIGNNQSHLSRTKANSYYPVNFLLLIALDCTMSQ